MRQKRVIYCERCGGTKLSGTQEFLVFHCLMFCSSDCRDDYRTADDERRETRVTAAKSKPARAA